MKCTQIYLQIAESSANTTNQEINMNTTNNSGKKYFCSHLSSLMQYRILKFTDILKSVLARRQKGSITRKGGHSLL